MTLAIDETHDPDLKSWVVGAGAMSDFPIQNLPFGVFSPSGGSRKRGGVAIGDRIVDLAALAASGRLAGEAQRAATLAAAESLNEFLSAGAEPRLALRRELSRLLSDASAQDWLEPLLHDMSGCSLHLPCRIGDYTDFFAGIHHARKAGQLFRPDSPLGPNYKHVPIGYHGRASSICPSGAAVRRPMGQSMAQGDEGPVFGPCRRLDFELELGIWIGRSNALGEPVPIAAAGEWIAGLCLLNDWSARDIQVWEAQPLGPFLAKNFQTTISPWIVTMEALAPFRIAQQPREAGDPRPLPHLWDDEDQATGAFAIDLDVLISTPAMRSKGLQPCSITKSAARHLYWTAAQLIAHHTSGGCNLRSGDILGTGTISADKAEGGGALLELTNAGANPICLPTGETRTFLEDGDEVFLRARAQREGFVSLGFGSCQGVVLPALG